MTRTLTLSLSVVAVLATPAAAGQLTVRGRGAEEALIRVSYSDLQLAEASDAEALRTRVHRAVRRGCGDLYGSTTPSQEWTCREVAANAAAPQIDRAIAAARSGLALAAKSVVVRFARR